jgi:hypothetical protein
LPTGLSAPGIADGRRSASCDTEARRGRLERVAGGARGGHTGRLRERELARPGPRQGQPRRR